MRSKTDIIAALKESRGVVKAAARILGCSHVTLAKYIKVLEIKVVRPHNDINVLRDVLSNSSSLDQAAATLGISLHGLIYALKRNNLTLTRTYNVKEKA